MSEEIDVREIPGIGDVTARKLAELGITEARDLLLYSPIRLAEMLNTAVERAERLILNAYNFLKERGLIEEDFVTADYLLEKVSMRKFITTGSRNLDELLGGGVVTGAVTEFYGEFGSGKCLSYDTPVLYLDDDGPNLESIEDLYNIYMGRSGEKRFDNGFIVNVDSIKVLAFDGINFRIVESPLIYREKVERIIEIDTYSGSKLRLTKLHPLLILRSGGLRWVRSGWIREGEYIACPGRLESDMFDGDDISSVESYLSNDLERRRKIRSMLYDELERGLLSLAGAEAIDYIGLSWDKVRSIREIDYYDYVYDVVVPKYHTFIGGESPFILHNTQLCHSLAVNVQLAEHEGGLNKNAIYIDTEKTFSPSRIVEMANARGLDPRETLARITVGRAYNTTHLLLLTHSLPKKIKENNVGFIAIDSAVAPFRAEYLGRGKLSERQQLLNRFMHELLRIAEIYDVAIVITNQVQEQPDIMFGDPTKPVGGHVVAHAVTYRIYLKKSKKNVRIAIIVDSPEHPPGEAVFAIDRAGIIDPNV